MSERELERQPAGEDVHASLYRHRKAVRELWPSGLARGNRNSERDRLIMLGAIEKFLWLGCAAANSMGLDPKEACRASLEWHTGRSLSRFETVKKIGDAVSFFAMDIKVDNEEGRGGLLRGDPRRETFLEDNPAYLFSRAADELLEVLPLSQQDTLSHARPDTAWTEGQKAVRVGDYLNSLIQVVRENFGHDVGEEFNLINRHGVE